MKKLTIFLILQLFINTVAYAQTASLPKILNEQGAKILITRINFKNKDQDWMTIYYESPNLNPINLKGLVFKNDKVFKTIDQDFIINSKNTITLTFKSSDMDNSNSLELFSSKSSLTGTTEQVILEDTDGTILDAICWSSKKPTDKEERDMQALFEGGGWSSSDPNSCLESEKIKSNETIHRMNTIDTNRANDWEILGNPKEVRELETTTSTTGSNLAPLSNPSVVSVSETVSTPNPIAIISTSREKATTLPAPVPEARPKTTHTSEPQKISTVTKKSTPKSASNSSSEKKTAQSKVKRKATKKSKKKRQSNGDLSRNIVINEIFAHAKKDDRHNEWIELYNQSKKAVNLGNWILDDGDKKSKGYVLPDNLTIAANGFAVIKAEISKISLNNTKDQVRLFDYTTTLIQTVEYEEAPIDKSYSRTVIQKADGTKKEEWLWEPLPTPKEANAEYQEFIGTIQSPPIFGETYTFTFTAQDGEEKNILFNEALIAGPLAQATFSQHTEAKLLVAAARDETTPKNYLLKRYEILNRTDDAKTIADFWWNFLLIGAGTILITFLILAKKWPLIQKILAQKGS